MTSVIKEPCQSGFRELCQHLSTNHERFFFTLSCKTETRFVTVFTRCKGIQEILDSRFHAADSGLQVLDIELFVRKTWIPDSNRWWDPDSLSCIPKAQDSGFHKQKFPDSLRGSILFFVLHSWGSS